MSYLTFGRADAQYWRLIDFLAIISAALWALVILTSLLRLGARYQRRRSYRRATKRQVAANLPADTQ